MQTFERLRLLMNNYQSVYAQTIELRLKASGSGQILLDTSRGGDISYETLLEWDNWPQLAKKLWSFKGDDLLAGKVVVTKNEK